jgi:hypothetical protein
MAKVTCNRGKVTCNVIMNVYIIYCVLRTYVSYVNMGFVNIKQCIIQNNGFWRPLTVPLSV